MKKYLIIVGLILGMSISLYAFISLSNEKDAQFKVGTNNLTCPLPYSNTENPFESVSQNSAPHLDKDH